MGDNADNKAQALEVIIDASIISSSQAVLNCELPQVDEARNTVQQCSSILTIIHAGYFRITLSLGAQALLWKILRIPTYDSNQPIHHLFRMLPFLAFLLLWSLNLLALVLLSFLYILRCYFHFHMVRAEFLHHIGANYLYAPWISWLLLLQSAPVIVPKTLFYQVLWWLFTIPILILDLKIYGQWFTTEKRFLSMVANPTSQISVIGNLAGALAAAQMGWKEVAVFMFSLGMAHYFVLFVTLYQRLAGRSRFPAIMRPAFFLFSAAPSLASLAWSSINGAFDTLSKMLFFLSLFLFMSLACRPALFKKSMRRFNVVWWAYSFPITFVALASSEYAQKEKGHIASGLMLVLSILSILVFIGLSMLTAINTNSLLGNSYSYSDVY
ncbi:Voltage-dependent anion channel [Parasponia andersonii]|uniref:Voltage-dependent anion channel n=1 Tax=Parasponia andersonii TaxID=3476 RepID=A0A2P5BTM4_PARAD|nr:Voltage-dependent anion channel [Parasponia andersonii]